MGRLLETPRVCLGAEHHGAAVGDAVGLQTFEDLLAIVQHRGGRIHRDGDAGGDLGIVPALALAVADRDHVVSEDAAEAGIPQDGGAPFWRRRRGVRFGRKSDGWHAVSRDCCLGHKLNSQQRKRVRSDDSIIAKFQDWLLLWNFISHNTLGPYQRLRSKSTWLT